mgnify:CR=1 FL=1
MPVLSNFPQVKRQIREPVISKRVRIKDLIEEHPSDFNKDDPFYAGAEFIYQTKPIVKITDTQLTDLFHKLKGELKGK